MIANFRAMKLGLCMHKKLAMVAYFSLLFFLHLPMKLLFWIIIGYVHLNFYLFGVDIQFQVDIQSEVDILFEVDILVEVDIPSKVDILRWTYN